MRKASLAVGGLAVALASRSSPGIARVRSSQVAPAFINLELRAERTQLAESA